MTLQVEPANILDALTDIPKGTIKEICQDLRVKEMIALPLRALHQQIAMRNYPLAFPRLQTLTDLNQNPTG